MRGTTFFLLPGLAMLLAVPSPLAAQNTAPAPTGANRSPLGGNAVPGLCALSMPSLYGDSKAGQAVAARLKVLGQQAQAEIAADRAALIKNAKALDAQKATLKPAELQQKREALASQRDALQAKLATRNRELALTRQKALQRVGAAADPDIRAAYTAHGCGMLINRDVVLGGNMSNDLTPAVVKSLDGHLTTLTFEREKVTAGAGTEDQ